MIGQWLKFGEGPPPRDGEAMVVLMAYTRTAVEIFEGQPPVQAEVAVHRYGALYLQNGSTMPIPYGSIWTSLPPPNPTGP